MRRTMSVMVVAAALLVALAACSARTKMLLDEEQKNGAHFATWSHMGYSVNRGTPETTTKTDIQKSQGDMCLPGVMCKWWGEVVRVQPIQ